MQVHQALHGYRNGHSYLAGSLALDPDTHLLLLQLTDASIPTEADPLLAAYPLIRDGLFAISRTWAAHEISRPGAVWTHTLLVDETDIGSLPDLSVLLALHSRPSKGLDGYREPVTIGSGESLPAVAVRQSSLAPALLSALYGEPGSPVILSHEKNDLRDIDALLCACWSQQWPRLRRRFSFRSRHKLTSTPFPFDVQAISRSRLRSKTDDSVVVDKNSPASTARWVNAATEDLREGPDGQFRRFLRQFGAESARGREDFAPLGNAFVMAVDRDDPDRLAETVALAYPRASDMTRLKQHLFGPPTIAASWPSETSRLRAITRRRISGAYDLEVLRVKDRVEGLWVDDRAAALRLLTAATDDRLGQIVRDAGLRHVGATELPAVIRARPDLAEAVLQRRPQLLGADSLWTELDDEGAELVMTFVADHPALLEKRGRALAQALVMADRPTPAAMLANVAPPVFRTELAGALVDNAIVSQKAWRAYLGAAAVEIMFTAWSTHKPVHPDALMVFASELDPRIEPVKSANPTIWSPLLTHKSLPKRLRASALLLFIGLDGEGDSRRHLLTASFGPVHQALADERLPAAAWSWLDERLPDRDDWDRCGRLRRAVAKKVMKESWEPDQVLELLQASGPEGRRLVQEIEDRKHGKSFVEAVVRAAMSWWR